MGAAGGALPVLMAASEAEAKFGDHRRWAAILVPLTTLIVPFIGFGAFFLYVFSDDFGWNIRQDSPKAIQMDRRNDALGLGYQKDAFEKGLEEAWEKAKPAGSTVTVQDKLKQLSTQNSPHWVYNKIKRKALSA